MKATRRHVLQIGGLFLAGLALPEVQAGSRLAADISMRGNADGSRVWFDPIGIRIEPGQSLRWTNLDPGNSHTATAYHPHNQDHALRIPPGATPWDSGYLLPNESYTVRFTKQGVYDYFCIPHEQAGMAGRIIVGWPQKDFAGANGSGQHVPEAALRAFPSVEEIMRNGAIHPN